MAVLPVNGNACDVSNTLLDHGLLLAADFSSLDSRLLEEGADRNARRRVTERERAHLSFSKPEDDYLPPDYAFRELEAGMAKLHGRGYLHLTAPAGQGKSVLARALRHDGRDWGPAPARLRNALVYSLLRGEPTNPRFVLEKLGNQARRLDESGLLHLRDVDQLDSVPAARQWIKHLLHETRLVLVDSDNHEPLLIVVDGLDELRDSTGDRDERDPFLLNMLPPADDLPEGCYILLTSRPSLPASLSATLSQRQEDYGANLFQRIELCARTEGYAKLLGAFLSKGLGDDAKSLIPSLVEKSGGSFLFVRLLRDLLRLFERRGGKLSELTSLEIPELSGVFPAYLEELKLDVNYHYSDPNRFDNWHRPVLLMLALAREPVDFACLRLWMGKAEADRDTDHILECTLDELAPLLREEVLSLPIIRNVYDLGHSELAEWFAANDDEDWGPAAKAEVSRSIARHGRRFFEANAPRLTDEAGFVVYYHYWHVPSHLLDIGDAEAAANFLAADWQNDVHEAITQPMRTTVFWPEALRVATVRTAQYLRIFQSLPPDSSDWLGSAMWCMRRLATSLLDRIEAHAALGQPTEALRTVDNLSKILDSKQTQPVHLTDALHECARREYWRLVIERDLWRTRLTAFLGDRESAASAVCEAYAKLVSLGRLFVGERGEREVVWWASSISEIVDRSINLCRRAAPTAAWLGLNQVALGISRELIDAEGGLSYWIEHDPRLVDAFAQSCATRARLLRELAETEYRESMLNDGLLDFLAEEEVEAPRQAALRLCENAIDQIRASLPGSAGGAIDGKKATRYSKARFSLGKLVRAAAEIRCSLGNQPAACDAYRDAFTTFEEVLPWEPSEAMEQLLTCCIDWVSIAGIGATTTDGVPTLARAAITLTVYHERFGEQTVTHGSRRAVEIVNRWIRATRIFDQLGGEFQAAWRATCRAFQTSSTDGDSDERSTGMLKP